MILAKDWMTTRVITITKEKTVQEACRNMREHNFGDLVVIENGLPTGIITERDICYKVAAENIDTATTLVESVMTHSVVSAHVNDPITEISKRMSLSKIKKMPIIEEGKLVGIITTTDLKRIIVSIEKDLLGIATNL